LKRKYPLIGLFSGLAIAGLIILASWSGAGKYQAVERVINFLSSPPILLGFKSQASDLLMTLALFTYWAFVGFTFGVLFGAPRSRRPLLMWIFAIALIGIHWSSTVTMSREMDKLAGAMGAMLQMAIP